MAVRDLCRREGIKPRAFYAWTKDFMEAGKERLTRDVVRDDTRQEIEQIKRENADLKHLVAGLSLEVYRLKKRLFLYWRATTALAHECCGKDRSAVLNGGPIRVQAAGTDGNGDTQEHILPVAAGAAR